MFTQSVHSVFKFAQLFWRHERLFRHIRVYIYMNLQFTEYSDAMCEPMHAHERWHGCNASKGARGGARRRLTAGRVASGTSVSILRTERTINTLIDPIRRSSPGRVLVSRETRNYCKSLAMISSLFLRRAAEFGGNHRVNHRRESGPASRTGAQWHLFEFYSNKRLQTVVTRIL